MFAEEFPISELFKHGVTLTILGIFALAVWKVLIWARDNVATPVVEAHLDLIAELKSAIPKQSKAAEVTAANMKHQTEKLDDISKSNTRIADCAMATTEMLKRQNDMFAEHETSISEAKRLIESLPCRPPIEVSAVSPAKKTDEIGKYRGKQP